MNLMFLKLYILLCWHTEPFCYICWQIVVDPFFYLQLPVASDQFACILFCISQDYQLNRVRSCMPRASCKAPSILQYPTQRVSPTSGVSVPKKNLDQGIAPCLKIIGWDI